jgi:murein DD-endopeptidase MepM/ murein hydrolase activator NlpD
MFKSFSIFSLIFVSLISFIFSFNTNKDNELYYPIKNISYISSNFGYRHLFNKNQFHNGIDIPATQNTKIYSLSSGIVKYIGFDTYGYGNFVILLYNNGYQSIYGHLDDNILVKIGDKVYPNQVVGFVGPKVLNNGKSNGSTTGPHLHFTVYDNKNNLIDPLILKYKK